MMSAPDDTAFARLYETYIDGVFNYCLFHTGDVAAAEDLAADTFTRAWAARDRYQSGKGEFSTWLFTIARNAVMDWHRQRTRHPIFALDPSMPDGGDPLEIQVEARARYDQLLLLVQTLPSAERELIALKFGAGMTNRAIARLLNRSESGIGTALYVVMRKLRAELKVPDG